MVMDYFKGAVCTVLAHINRLKTLYNSVMIGNKGDHYQNLLRNVEGGILIESKCQRQRKGLWVTWS